MTNASIVACWRESPLWVDEPQPINGEQWTNLGGLYRLLVQAVVPGHEAAYGLQWLFATLSADSTLAGFAPGGIWRGMAPPTTVPPFVIVQHQAASDVLTLNAFRIMSNALFQVKAVGPGSASMIGNLVSAASRIDQLIGSPPTSGSV